MPRRLALIATTLALTIVLAGCGSDDDSSDDERDTTTTAAEEESTTTADEADEPEGDGSTTTEGDAPESTEAPDEETTTTSAVAPGEGDPEFCAAYAAFNEEFEELPSETVEDIKAGSEALEGAMTELSGVAPEELAEDMDLLVGAAGRLAEEVQAATTVEEAQEITLEVFGGEEFSAAADRVDGYFTQGCPQSEEPEVEDGGVETPETVTPG